MRTEKELWEVVLSRPDLFEWGLCIWVGLCLDNNLISGEELLFLYSKIDSRKNLLENRGTYWIGPKDEIQPRIDWINERIKQL